MEPQTPDVPEAFMIAPMLNVFAKVPLVCGRASVALVLLASRLRVHTVVGLACVGRAPIIAIRATSAKVTGTIFLLTKQTNTFSEFEIQLTVSGPRAYIHYRKRIGRYICRLN